MKFKKYNSLENHYRTKFIDQVKAQGLDAGTWVALEKAHGANFSFHYDGKELKVAKRSSFCTGEFFNCQSVIDKHGEKVKKIWNRLQDLNDEIHHIVLYGELIGGGYDGKKHPQAKTVQKGLQYCPDNEFLAFDLEIDGTMCAHTFTLRLCNEFGIPHCPVITEGTFEDLLELNNEFNSLVPHQLGYNTLDNNICEGIVIKPLGANVYLSNGSRVIIKSKNSKFSEKKPSNKPKPTLESCAVEKGSVLLQYFTPQRVVNVLSKYDEVTTWKDFGKFAGLVFQDALEDYNKDQDADLKEELGDSWKVFVSNYKKASDDVVRQYFKENL